jgi:hypothetical protein
MRPPGDGVPGTREAHEPESGRHPSGTISGRILFIRGERVIVDADLAEFYGVSTKRLNEQVKRNRDHFPDDFMFQLTPPERSELVAKCDHLSRLKFAKALPYAFTEHGAIMAASVLNSRRAVEVAVFVVRAFVKIRRVLSEQRQLAQRLAQLERHLSAHDDQILGIVQAIRTLLGNEPVPSRRRIGFQTSDES